MRDSSIDDLKLKGWSEDLGMSFVNMFTPMDSLHLNRALINGDVFELSRLLKKYLLVNDLKFPESSIQNLYKEGLIVDN